MNGPLGKNRVRVISDRRHPGSWWVLPALLVLPWLLVAGCGGCGDSSTSVSPGGSGETTLQNQTPDRVLYIAVDNLDRQEEFPSGEMLVQVVDQLNQWVHAQKPSDDWKLDPLVAGLPAELAELPTVQSLDRLQFPRSDGLALQEAVWLRNVAGWARGNELADLSQARQLFDWTVRNIQLETMADSQDGRRLGQMPWETLLLGRGTAVERAWVFILLARQQGLDAALLALPDPEDPAGRPPRPWAVGVLSKGEVYPFDPALGLPLPGPDGVRLDDTGQLEVRPATLAQLAADDSLLRRLDLDRGRPYPVSSADLDRVVALVEASPSYLARRMKLIESRLLGQRRVVLSCSAAAQVERWKEAARIADAQLWVFSYQMLLEHGNAAPEQSQQRVMALLPFYAVYAMPARSAESQEPFPEQIDLSRSGKGAAAEYRPRRATSRKGAGEAPLRKARILHLKGQFAGPQGATEFYQQARPSDDQLANLAVYYRQIALKGVQRLPKDQRQAARKELQKAAADRARADGPLLSRAKQDASYWLGLMNLDQGLIELQRKNPDAAAKHHRVAIDYLLKFTIEASPGGPWTHGASYNLGRSYEATRQYDEAIARYAIDAASPSYFGNLLRARWINELRPEPAEESEEPISKD